MDNTQQRATSDGATAPGRFVSDQRHSPSPLKNLVVKSEYFLQSLLKYPLPARCPHCGSVRQTLLARKYSVARIVRCTECGLYFSRPIYRSWVTGSFYGALYSAGFATTLPDETHLEEWLTNGFRDTQRDAGKVLDKIRLHVSPASRTLLEIGCSWGYFLHQARGAGFDVTGIEIGANRRAFGQRRLGLPIVGDFSELPPRMRYDVVYTAHVLEHFTDLSAIFSHIAAVLKDEGVLFVEVPNFDPAQFGPKCFSIVGAVHPLGFDAEFFRANLPRHGLAVTGTFGSWDDLPDRPVSVSGSDVIIIRAAHARAS